MSKCNKCDHADTCKDKKQTVSGLPLPPLSQRSAKLKCWVCSCCYWRMQVSCGKRECDVCHAVKDLNDDSVQIKHTRG